jgi:granule-bound starch synthase
VYQARGEYPTAKTALCIHNIAFQGRFWPETFADLGLPEGALPKLAFTDGYDRVGGGRGAPGGGASRAL